jgi:cellulose biosynthesis protein BcsQ
MYVITFYSFKGGVGRTLALVNVAAHLALQGKSVLLVDFDLEAPGLDSFPVLRADRNVPGIVEFVTDYLNTGTSPFASNYIADCKVPGITEGKMMLMRSGIANHNYGARLGNIDWQKLYSENDGFLLIEDLKAQWQEQLKPDYVLIDSRTGHTDVGGICTRQLPDSVVACFIPNEENIAGLEAIATHIRNQPRDASGRLINLHFVLSNVPYLDDENGILVRRLKQAKARLGFEHPAATIHRYESLSLLENQIFVLRRRRTRLAKEYRQLAMVVTDKNIEDRDVVLRNLNRSVDSSIFLLSGDRSSVTTLERIQMLYANDGEVLHAASEMSKRLGREDEARLLIERARKLGFRSPGTILESAQEQLRRSDEDAALLSLTEALNHQSADYSTVSRAVELCLQFAPSFLPNLTDSFAFRKLPAYAQATICDQMFVRRDTLAIAERILHEVEKRSEVASTRDSIRVSLMLCLIGQGKFGDAMSTLAPRRPDPSSLDMVDAFNYGFAEWGATRRATSDFFARVLEIGRSSELRSMGKNTFQCLSLSAWIVGEVDTANRFWDRAEKIALADSANAFSGWRYLQVSPAQFLDDLQELRDLLNGVEIQPRVLRESWR